MWREQESSRERKRREIKFDCEQSSKRVSQDVPEVMNKRRKE